MLPDVALLTVFDFYLHEDCGHLGDPLEAWYTLVHVCREWRNLVFGSRRRLNLRLLCTYTTPVKEMLDIWPPLPLVLRSYGDREAIWDVDNLMAALEHNDRVHELSLFGFSNWPLEKVLAKLHQPFPALTDLVLQHGLELMLVDPDSFLGGSAPSLRSLLLDSIPFPGLLELLLTTTHLTDLRLWNISHTGYISSEAMVTSLSTLISLERLELVFESPIYPDRKSRLPPSLTRTILPVLTELLFSGVEEYLEDLVARIDAPLLHNLGITFFHQAIFDTPQLAQFIGRTPKFKAHDELRVHLSDWNVLVAPTPTQTSDQSLHLQVICSPSDQLSSLAQICGSSFPRGFISGVEHFYIEGGHSGVGWQGDVESIQWPCQWLEFFRPFTAVKGLYMSRQLAPRIVLTLPYLIGDSERVTEVLPALQTLFLEKTLPSGPIEEAIAQFVAARQLASRPIAISRWDSWERRPR
jgi:hypothetical protein